ncbi:MAG: asparagine synthetase B [bacterium]
MIVLQKIYQCMLLLIISAFMQSQLISQKVLIPMDLSQTDHLKAYGLTYWALTKNVQTEWLLNYRGGSFLLDAESFLIAECRIRGVSFEQLSMAQAQGIYAEVQSEKTNMDVVRLEKPPRIAVYTPPGSRPWDDAVTMVLEYAEVKYDKIWDEEVLRDKLSDYDWLHLHHEDFTGQYGKFFANYATAPWYIQQVTLLETTAKKMGFKKVSALKRAIVQKIKSYIEQGGFMFAMCSATDSYDIALSAATTDICESMFDGDPVQPNYQSKIDFTQTFAFENFEIYTDPYRYEYSTIDVDASFRVNNQSVDYFTLFDFSAKYDPVPTMLTQCHANVIKNFLGQTTAFHKEQIKKSVTNLAEREGTDEVKYLHGNVGRGTFTWYGGHDPEDYQHAVGDPPTDISLHKNSPGYRLILNNILFPAAKKKKQKT